MRTLKTSEAAALLGVSPNTLRAWEQRFGYPSPRRSPGRHRSYVHAEIEALARALEDGLSVSSAISAVSESVGSEGRTLADALASFRAERADDAMESSLQLRSLERSVEEVLLPTLADLRRREGPASAAWCFSAGWAGDWLRRARRLAPPAMGGESVLIGEAGDGDLDRDGPWVRAFELFCARSAARVLSLPLRAVDGLEPAVHASAPTAVVVAGAEASDAAVEAWLRRVRESAGGVPVALYLRGRATGWGRGGAVPVLPAEPGRACDALLRGAALGVRVAG